VENPRRERSERWDGGRFAEEKAIILLMYEASAGRKPLPADDPQRPNALALERGAWDLLTGGRARRDKRSQLIRDTGRDREHQHIRQETMDGVLADRQALLVLGREGESPRGPCHTDTFLPPCFFRQDITLSFVGRDFMDVLSEKEAGPVVYTGAWFLQLPRRLRPRHARERVLLVS